MKKVFGLIFKLLSVLVVAFFVFFFWASSTTLDENEYATLVNKSFPAESTNDSVFTVLTYNIGYLSGMTNNRAVEKPKSLFENNLNKVIAETRNINPHIIAFQEIDFDATRSFHIDQSDAIADLGYAYSAKSVNWDKRYLPFPYWPISMHFGKVVSGQSIISKFPIRDHKRIVLQRVSDAPYFRDAFYIDRLAQVATVDINGREVVMINVHLEAFDAPTRKQQMQEVMQLLNDYKEQPLILLGDFNAEARDPNSAIQELLHHPDFGVAAFDAANPENTFDAVNPIRRIDYIFYNKHYLTEVSSKVLMEFGDASDHIPVALSFRFRE